MSVTLRSALIATVSAVITATLSTLATLMVAAAATWRRRWAFELNGSEALAVGFRIVDQEAQHAAGH